MKNKAKNNTFNQCYKLYDNNTIKRIEKEQKEIYILFFELLKLSLEESTFFYSLNGRVCFLIDEFEEFKDLYLISVFDDVVSSLIENNKLDKMTDKEIIDEIIFQLI